MNDFSLGYSENTKIFYVEYKTAKKNFKVWKLLFSKKLFLNLYKKMIYQEKTNEKWTTEEQIFFQKIKGNVLFRLGFIFSLQGEFNQSQKTLFEALQVFKKLELGKKEALVCLQIGRNILFFLYDDKSTKFFERAMEYAKKTKNKKIEARAYMNFGAFNILNGNYKEAIVLQNKALNLAESIEYNYVIVRILNDIALGYEESKEYEKSKEYYEKSLKLARKIGEKFVESIVLSNMSKIFLVDGEYEKAIKNCEESLKIRKEIGYNGDDSFVYDIKSSIYKEMGNFELSLECCENSIKLEKSKGNTKREVTTMFKVGILYFKQDLFEKSLEIFKKNLKIAKENNYMKYVDLSHLYIGNTLLRMKNYKDALVNYEIALKGKRDIGDKSAVAVLLSEIGVLYKETEKFPKSIYYLEESLKVEETNKTRSEVLSLKGERLFQLALCYLSFGKILKSLSAFESSMILYQKLKMNVEVEALKEYIEDIYKTESFKNGCFVKYEIFKILKDQNFVDILFHFTKKSKE